MESLPADRTGLITTINVKSTADAASIIVFPATAIVFARRVGSG